MENHSILKKAEYHTWFHHNDSTGYITLARKTKNGFKQYHYKPTELANHLSNWLGEDIYFSQNTFYKPRDKSKRFVNSDLCMLIQIVIY